MLDQRDPMQVSMPAAVCPSVSSYAASPLDPGSLLTLTLCASTGKEIPVRLPSLVSHRP